MPGVKLDETNANLMMSVLFYCKRQNLSETAMMIESEFDFENFTQYRSIEKSKVEPTKSKTTQSIQVFILESQ